MNVFSVVNEAYADLAEFWADKVRAASGRSPQFYCSDDASFQRLSLRGYCCHLRLPPEPLSKTQCKKYRSCPYPNDHAVYTNFLKVNAGRDALLNGKAFVYSDLDAIWLKDPLPMIGALEVDMAFQPGSFPRYVKKRWGFAMCAGFFHMRPKPQTVALLEAVARRFRGSDQLAFNNVFSKQHDIVWDKRPQDWEHCQQQNGWTTPILGKCRSTGLRLAALPHVYFQRHNLRQDTLDHCIICHPNAQKDQHIKFATLSGLGVKVPADI